MTRPTYARFFEPNVYGYFCHAAVGIPEGEYDALAVEMKPIFENYKEIIAANAVEFKHTEFKTVPFKERELAKRIRDVPHAARRRLSSASSRFSAIRMASAAKTLV